MMKSKLILIALVSFVLLCVLSCGETADDCPVIPLNEYILGEWKVSGSLVSFSADGSYTDADNLLDKSNVQADLISSKSYSLPDSNLVLSVTDDTGISFSTTYKILNTECQSFDIEWVSGTTKFTLIR